jgi:hypothetical protein
MASFVELPRVEEHVRLSNRLAHFFELPYNSVMPRAQIEHVLTTYLRAARVVDDDNVVSHHPAAWTLLRMSDSRSSAPLSELLETLRRVHLTVVRAPPDEEGAGAETS